VVKEYRLSVFDVWKQIFGNFKYLVTGFVLAILFYSFNVTIPNIALLKYNYSNFGFFSFTKLFFNLFIGFGMTILLSSYISLIIISILFGVLVSLLIFKVSSAKESKGHWFSGIIGSALGIIAPGCAACGIGLLSVLGLSSAFLTYLPLKGLEISILAILLLSLTILKTSKDLTMCEICKIHYNTQEMKGGQHKWKTNKKTNKNLQ